MRIYEVKQVVEVIKTFHVRTERDHEALIAVASGANDAVLVRETLIKVKDSRIITSWEEE